MALPLAAPVASSIAAAATSAGVRSTLSNMFTSAVGGIARAFGFSRGGQSESNTDQGDTASTQQSNQPDTVSATLANRASPYARPSDVVNNIANMSSTLSNNAGRERQDVGESLSGSGNIVSLLSSIDRNVQAITSIIFSTRAGAGGGGSRTVDVARRSTYSPGAQADMRGLLAAAGLAAAGQVITGGAAAFQRGAENRAQANEQAEQNREQLSERQRAGASPGQVMAGEQVSNYTVSNEELANLQEMLETPERRESESNRTLRESLDRQLTTIMNQETVGRGGTRLTEEMVRYRDERVARERQGSNQNTPAPSPNTEVIEQPYEVESTGSEDINRIINDYQEIIGGGTPPPANVSSGERELLPLQERSTRQDRSNIQSQPSAFRRALSTAVPRFSLSNAMDVITGRNLSRSRAANAIDSEYTSTNINPVVEAPMQQQAPTIINNNNIIQGGGQSQPSMSAATGTPSMPAGSGVPPIIGTYPTPPSSPAFNNYSN